jgi:hypothetical protein
MKTPMLWQRYSPFRPVMSIIVPNRPSSLACPLFHAYSHVSPPTPALRSPRGCRSCSGGYSGTPAAFNCLRPQLTPRTVPHNPPLHDNFRFPTLLQLHANCHLTSRSDPCPIRSSMHLTALPAITDSPMIQFSSFDLHLFQLGLFRIMMPSSHLQGPWVQQISYGDDLPPCI